MEGWGEVSNKVKIFLEKLLTDLDITNCCYGLVFSNRQFEDYITTI